uniref:C2H2-type domain-containing protein n=1 Tax=Anopheles minimus TaxID=112268 RepID=A0A182WDR8_9DIPT
MALKMLYRGPSTRLETLIEKIQQNTNVFGGGMIAPGAMGGIGGVKEFSLGQELYSSHTSSSFSPSISDGMTTPNSITNDTNDGSMVGLGSTDEKPFRQGGNHHIHPRHHHHAHHRRTAGTGGGHPSSAKEGAKSSLKHHQLNNNNSSSHNHNNNNNNHGSNSKGLNSTYHCQFCEKTFPRLGYLKKHEQVSYTEVV